MICLANEVVFVSDRKSTHWSVSYMRFFMAFSFWVMVHHELSILWQVSENDCAR